MSLLHDYLRETRSCIEKIDRYGYAESIEIKEEIRAGKQVILQVSVVLVDGSSLYIKEYKERRDHPRVESSPLHEMKHCYKIKLRSAGYRLVYEVRDQEIVIVVIAVGKREKNQAYLRARQRL